MITDEKDNDLIHLNNINNYNNDNLNQLMKAANKLAEPTKSKPSNKYNDQSTTETTINKKQDSNILENIYKDISNVDNADFNIKKLIENLLLQVNNLKEELNFYKINNESLYKENQQLKINLSVMNSNATLQLFEKQPTYNQQKSNLSIQSINADSTNSIVNDLESNKSTISNSMYHIFKKEDYTLSIY